MIATDCNDESSSERQRGKHRKFRGTTTVLTSILRIGASRENNDEMTIISTPSDSTQAEVNCTIRRNGIRSNKSSKNHQRHGTYPSTSASSIFHPRIPPFPGHYLTTMNTSVPMQTVSTQIPQVLRPTPPPFHASSLSFSEEQTYYMPSQVYSQYFALANHTPMSYNSSSQSHGNLQSYMYMKAYLRDPWLNEGFRLMILLPVGHREDGTYGILNAGVKPEQIYSLCFYYADNILYYSIPDDSCIYFIPN